MTMPMDDREKLLFAPTHLATTPPLDRCRPPSLWDKVGMTQSKAIDHLCRFWPCFQPRVMSLLRSVCKCAIAFRLTPEEEYFSEVRYTCACGHSKAYTCRNAPDGFQRFTAKTRTLFKSINIEALKGGNLGAFCSTQNVARRGPCGIYGS